LPFDNCAEWFFSKSLYKPIELEMWRIRIGNKDDGRNKVGWRMDAASPTSDQIILSLEFSDVTDDSWPPDICNPTASATTLSRGKMTPRTNFFCTGRGGSILIAGVAKIGKRTSFGCWWAIALPSSSLGSRIIVGQSERPTIHATNKASDFLRSSTMKKRTTNGYWIFRTRITTKNGKVLYAWQYGVRAFKL
jgi:hypothetical protein